MKKVLAFFILILLIIGIAAGIYLVKKQQSIKSKATIEGTQIEFIDNSGNLLTSASSRNIKLRLIFSASSSAVPSASPFASPSAAPSPSASASAVPTSIPTIQNLVVNGSFETAGNGQTPQNWEQWDGAPFGPLIRSDDKFREGSWSLKGNIAVNPGHSITQTVNIEPNKSYAFSAWVFTDDLRTFIDTGDNGDPGKLSGLVRECETRATEQNGWHKLTCNFQTTAQASRVQVRLIAYSINTWFDDIEVKESTNSAVQGVAFAQEAFPTAYRIANFQSGLEFSSEQLFDQNSKEVSWRLSQGNGQKTVYVQFKVNGVWQAPISNQINLNYTDPPGPAYGIQIDVRDQAKIPTQTQADLVKPKWVRFVYPCTDTASSSACPNDWHKTNLINSIPNSDTIKRLAIVNGETAWGSPVGSTDVALWRAYIDGKYLPVLKQVVQNTGFNLSGVELWNEEDHNSDPNVIPYIPQASYAYLLKSSSALIRSINPNLNIISGGILGNANYLKEVKAADADAFSDIDAIGVHPYVTPDNINQITTILNSLKQSNTQVGITQPFWITEIGTAEFTHPQTPKNQKEFMEKAFDQFVTFSPVPQVVNWYAFVDTMGGSDNSQTWGLFRANGTIKPAGALFKEVSSPTLPVSPSPQATSSATPSASPVPTQRPGKSADFNGDGKINSFDVSLLLRKWRISTRIDIDNYDLNSDGVINAFDYALLVKNFK